MGNTVATPSNDRRPSHVSVTRSLRKMTSSSTLSSLRLYRHQNRSETSVLSRQSHSSTRDKILDISKPTLVEHGIHVEYNNGKYMGLPDVWQQSSLPSGDILDTHHVAPHLVPSPVKQDVMSKDGTFQATPRSKSRHDTTMMIGKPYNVQHNVHVEVGKYGYKGLPEKWQHILLASGIPEEVVKNNPSTVERVLNHVRMPDSLQSDTTHLPKGYAPPSRARSSKLLHLSILKTSADIPAQLDSKSGSLDTIVDSTTDPNTVYTDFVLIAEGESGPMYAAKHINTQRIVAIKKIALDKKENIGKIRNELMAMKMSRHPNIVELVACYSIHKEIWVVMECMDVSLADMISLENIQLTESHMRRVIRDLLRALTRLHRLGRMHRDIRSDNILLNSRGEVKLADFRHCAQLTTSKPHRQSIVGTPYWMAPEVIKGQEYDTKVDIWSLGVVLLEMAQGDPPYVEHPPLKALFLIASHGLPALQEPDRWSEEFKEFLKLCTTEDPGKRPDADTLLQHPFLTFVATSKDMIELIEDTRTLESMLQQEEELDDLQIKK
ncbi:kinase-like domain-containing protein [Sporodiniella umbellata]|nr:kinase-like domain-containing protein [Sporodiniella umbellata]